MKRDFADFWNLLWELALGVCAAFALLNLFAPQQDLPWKPLDLSHPIGTATAAKVDDFVLPAAAAPEEITAVTEACMQVLREAGVQVERAPDRDDGGFCVVRGAVRITGGAVTPLPSSLVMQCPLAVRYVIWDRQVLQPAAEAAFGSRVASLNDVGTYSCRRIYGQTDLNARPSEHARANALDIGGMTLADGRRVSVLADWPGDGPRGAEGASFLRRIRDGACRVFSTVLTPDYNDAHANHLHLDGAPRSLCALGPSRGRLAAAAAKAG
ncbi:extensin family protein [Brevundimonas sp.]|uniref:extensin-like domain-containing protein n=1 Tax=Brevundimonas sp. TaxID=1871086 RepID=UPI001212DF9F|nr:extensin family protein [Brevundimonas sp.]TAJ67534.1 MAG: extensin family protein [Brevundimonas sp.]